MKTVLKTRNLLLLQLKRLLLRLKSLAQKRNLMKKKNL